MRAIAGTAALLLVLAGCATRHGAGSSTVSRTGLAEHQRDSILGRSSLPGASTVGRALSATDEEARHAAGLNAAVDSLPH